MSFIFLFAIFISICLIVTLYAIKPDTLKPSKLYYVLLIFTVIIWVSFLTGMSTIFPDKFSLILWNSCWIGILILGGITFIFEFKRSLAFAFSALLISLINGGFYLLAKFIASM